MSEEKSVKKVVKKKTAPKKEVVTRSGSEIRPSSGRKVAAIMPSQAKAIVEVGGKSYKVVRHRKIKTGEWFLGTPKSGSVRESDWLEGKAELVF